MTNLEKKKHPYLPYILDKCIQIMGDKYNVKIIIPLDLIIVFTRGLRPFTLKILEYF